MNVDGHKLSMVRGDSESLTVKIKDRPFVTGDIIEMKVRKRSTSEEVILYKKVTTFDEGIAIIEINPEDTNKADFGKYVYDIQWTDPNGKVKTIIEKEKDNFILREEVTY